MANTKVNDFLFTAGQNNGIETAVLPMPQLISVGNLRMRKASRWGKRFGHTALPTANLGTGTGAIRSMGGGKGGSLTCFAVVDDQCSLYNQTAAAFIAPPAVTASLARVAGAASGWLPDTSFFPVPQQSLKNQTTTPCATCYAFGYLWTAIQYTEPASADKKLRLVATDPSDQTVVRVDDFSATTAAFGGNAYPKLNLVGSTLMLTYTLGLAAGATNLKGRSLTGIGATWSAESTLAASPGAIIYDASTYSATGLAVAIVGALGSLVSLLTTAFAVSATQAIADVSGNPLTEISVVGSSSVAAGEIYVGYACAATPSAKVRVFTANLAGTVGTATLSAIAKKPLLALLQAGGVRAVYNSTVTAGTPGFFWFRDVTTAATAAGNQFTQFAAYPIANPFAIGSSVYLWTKTETATLSYATLLRLPDPASISGGAGVISCPLEMSVQDYLVSSGQGITELDLRGVPTIARLGTTASYVVPVPTLYAGASTIAAGHDFRILQAKHYTDSANSRSVQALYADSSAFLPMGALTRVDDRGAIESGFVHAPLVYTAVPAVGAGALTPLSDYYYTAIYKSRNSNGRFEESAPTTPVKVTMGAGQNQNTVTAVSLGISARANTAIEIYRTLSNGQTFYLVGVVDSTFGFVTFLDQLSDTAIATQQALYTQVGQTLPNALPPPSRFGCVGGGRLFLGGQMRPDVIQASKLIFGDQSPSFCDSDAFRIVLPAACTGLAWMDVLCVFTSEGIYIASGDGPTDDGVGDFGTLTRMPYELGCIEPRSVVVVDDGCFFQTARGLYLLPRGFGAPVPAGDNVQGTFAPSAFPVITGAAVLTKNSEQTVHWTCATTDSINGARVIYDLAHKVWSTDSVAVAGGIGAGGVAQWSGGEVVAFHGNISAALPLALTNGVFADNAVAIQTNVSTGDLRPFGVLSEGAITKVQLLAELRSACTLNIFAGSEWSAANMSRVFALAGGDYGIGEVTVTDIEVGNAPQRDGVRLKIQFSEISTGEGLAFIAMALEHEQGEGLKRASPLSRVT